MKRCTDWRALRRCVGDDSIPVAVQTAALDRLYELFDHNPYATAADKQQARAMNEFVRCYLRLIAHADRILAR